MEVKKMEFGLEIIERLASQKLGATGLAYTTFLAPKDPKDINRFFKNHEIIICPLEEAMKKEQELENEVHEEEKVMMLKVRFEVIKLKEGVRGIKLSLPDLKNMKREKKEFLESFLTEAQQLINEREVSCEIRPFASTTFLKQMYEKAIVEYGCGGYSVIKEIENIFGF